MSVGKFFFPLWNLEFSIISRSGKPLFWISIKKKKEKSSQKVMHGIRTEEDKEKEHCISQDH